MSSSAPSRGVIRVFSGGINDRTDNIRGTGTRNYNNDTNTNTMRFRSFAVTSRSTAEEVCEMFGAPLCLSGKHFMLGIERRKKKTAVQQAGLNRSAFSREILRPQAKPLLIHSEHVACGEPFGSVKVHFVCCMTSCSALALQGTLRERLGPVSFSARVPSQSVSDDRKSFLAMTRSGADQHTKGAEPEAAARERAKTAGAPLTSHAVDDSTRSFLTLDGIVLGNSARQNSPNVTVTARPIAPRLNVADTLLMREFDSLRTSLGRKFTSHQHQTVGASLSGEGNDSWDLDKDDLLMGEFDSLRASLMRKHQSESKLLSNVDASRHSDVQELDVANVSSNTSEKRPTSVGIENTPLGDLKSLVLKLQRTQALSTLQRISASSASTPEDEMDAFLSLVDASFERLDVSFEQLDQQYPS